MRMQKIDLALLFPSLVAFAAAYVNIIPTRLLPLADMSRITKSTLSGMRLDFNTSGDGVKSPNRTAISTACLSASSSWWEASKSYRRIHPDGSSYIEKTATGYQLSASTYKYCDGVPRVSGTEAITIPYTATLLPTQWVTAWSPYPEMSVEFPIPPPLCSVDALDCKSALESYSSKLQRTSVDEMDISERHSPSCSTTSTSHCVLQADGAHLIYWPSTLVQGSTYSCDNSTILKEIVPPTDTELVTAVVNGTTYTSPTLYISFDSVWNLYADVAGPPTTTMYSVVISIDSRRLSSFRYGSELVESHSFNFLDLTGPVPLAVYKDQLSCGALFHDNQECQTIFDDYYPNISGPQELKNADSAFASCELPDIPILDPPIALQRQDGLINTETITPAGGPTAEPALPSKTSQLNQAPKTADPTHQGDPSVQASSRGSSQPADSLHPDPIQNSQVGDTPLPSKTSGSPTSIWEESDPKPSSTLEISLQENPSDRNGGQQDPSLNIGGQANPSSNINNQQVCPSGVNGAQNPSDTTVTQQNPYGSGSSTPINNLQGLLSSTRSHHSSLDGGVHQEGAKESKQSSKNQQEEQSKGDLVHDNNTIMPQIRPQSAPPLLEPATSPAGGWDIPKSNPAIATIGTVPIFQAPGKSGHFLVGNMALSPGGSAVTIDNTPVSLGDNRLIVGGNSGSTYMIPSRTQFYTVAATAFSANSNGNNVLVTDLRFSAVGPAATVNDQGFSMAVSDLVLGDSIVLFKPLNSISTVGPLGVIATAGSQPIAFIQSGGKVIVAGTTLSEGGRAKLLNGQVISVAKSGIVLGGSTVPISALATSPPQTNTIYTLGNLTYTAGSDLAFRGPSAPPSDKAVHPDSNGIPINEQSTSFSHGLKRPTPSPGIGALIMSAFGYIGGTGSGKVTEASPNLEPSPTNSQDSARPTSSVGMAAFIMSAFGHIGEEATTKKLTNSTSPTLEPSGPTSSSIRATSSSSMVVESQKTTTTGALVTSRRRSGAIGRPEVMWMPILLWLSRLLI